MFASLKRLTAVLGIAACCITAVQAQQYQFNGSSGQEQKSTDPRNRARIHTELGAMYFQAGNHAVALDELQIALNADSSYYQAYSVRGLVRTALKEYDKAESDFRRALDIAPNDPEVNKDRKSVV
jgi:type IV pilus assembly protein PilF